MYSIKQDKHTIWMLVAKNLTDGPFYNNKKLVIQLSIDSTILSDWQALKQIESGYLSVHQSNMHTIFFSDEFG